MYHNSPPNPLEGLGMHNDWHGELGKFIPMTQHTLTTNQNVFRAPLAVANTPKTMLRAESGSFSQTAQQYVPQIIEQAGHWYGKGWMLQNGIIPISVGGTHGHFTPTHHGAQQMGMSLSNGRFSLPPGYYAIKLEMDFIASGPAQGIISMRDITGNMILLEHHTNFANPINTGYWRGRMLKPWTLGFFAELKPGSAPIGVNTCYWKIVRESKPLP